MSALSTVSTVFAVSALSTVSTIFQGLKRGLIVSKRLTEAHIWLIVNMIRAFEAIVVVIIN